VKWFRRKEPQESAPERGEASQTVEGERGIASVNRPASLQTRLSNVLAFGLMSVLAVGFMGWYYGHAIAIRKNAQNTAHAASSTRRREI